MNAHVHFTLTRRWAREAGLSEADADTVARWDVTVDRLFPGSLRQNLGYHFARHGAGEVGEAYLARAVREGDLRALGIALHCLQDGVAHGRFGKWAHWPGVDIWRRRSRRVRSRLERETKDAVREFIARDDRAERSQGGASLTFRSRSRGSRLPHPEEVEIPAVLPPDHRM